ncbi:MAG: response regulator [Deltaproteobacteria bacterium]|nr:response regulator [Deltaproteobacteria bacterium]
MPSEAPFERAVFEQMSESVAIYDRDARVRYLNPTTERLFGMKREELIGRTLWEVFPGAVGNPFHQAFVRVAATGVRESLDHYYAPWDSWFENEFFVVEDSVCVVAREITDRKAAERALKEREEALVQADRRKDRFLATLAHELRNPLAPLRTGLALLERGGCEAAPRVLPMMERQLGHMVRLIDDLLDVSRVSSGKIVLKKEKVHLRALVESAIETSRPLVESRRHTLVVSLPTDPIVLEVDAVRIAQVLSNLLNNAAKYTPDGGRIEVDAQVADGRVVIRVTDTGVGIAPDVLPRAFDMFTQVGHTLERADGGLGIGLALARSLAEMHGGALHGASEGPGRGSTFTLELPAAETLVLDAAPPEEQAAPISGAPRRVLLVDDNEDATELLAELLANAGHTTRVAFDGPSALALASTFLPEVILLDIGLPGMNGYEVAAELRRRPELQGALIVALTGWGSDADRQRSREAGFDVHLTKPVETRVIEALLRRPRHSKTP